MKPIIYYRPSLAEEKEILTFQKYFETTTSRVGITNKLVIARYSAYPFYKELENDLLLQQSNLINSYKQHRFIADLGNYTNILKELTPQTWNRIEQVPESAFPIIVKGETNGKKFLWNSHMFAENRQKAVDILCKLQDDGLIGDQNIYYRKFIPLKTYMVGFNGLPITKEFRVFICDGQVISKGYYWSNYVEDLIEKPNVNDIPITFLNKVIDLIGKNARFYVIDVAETESGDWVVIELNDGQQSGLSENDPEALYCNLSNVLNKRKTIQIKEPYNDKVIIEEDCKPIVDYIESKFNKNKGIL